MRECFLLAYLILISLVSHAQADNSIVYNHLLFLTQSTDRSYLNTKRLDSVADYIHHHFAEYAQEVREQKFSVGGRIYRNVICSFGTQHKERIIVGSHYDVCGKQAGADDNASGTTGLLELARMLADKKLNYRVDLVAYTLEEPPYFRTEMMGSYMHAKELHDNHIAVKGMISLEMIGYFDERKRTQDYPLGIMKVFYGTRGNYIATVQKFGNGSFANRFRKKFRRSCEVRSKKLKVPAWVPGVDFSDHLNYWKFGYSALLITDTAFYRNKNYHEPTDTIETLNIHQMCKVIDGVLQVLISFK